MKGIGLLLVFCLLASAAPAGAEDEIDVGTSLKINRAVRHQMIEDKSTGSAKDENSAATQEENDDPCRGVEIGNVQVGRGAAPREITVIVTGDVISVPSRRCR